MSHLSCWLTGRFSLFWPKDYVHLDDILSFGSEELSKIFLTQLMFLCCHSWLDCCQLPLVLNVFRLALLWIVYFALCLPRNPWDNPKTPYSKAGAVKLRIVHGWPGLDVVSADVSEIGLRDGFPLWAGTLMNIARKSKAYCNYNTFTFHMLSGVIIPLLLCSRAWVFYAAVVDNSYSKTKVFDTWFVA